MRNSWAKGYNDYSNDPSGNTDIAALKTITESRDSHREKLQTVWTVTDYEIVGMDATKVGTAIQAIDDYVTKLENKTKQINENADMDVAIKSDIIQASVKKYIEKVEEYCANLCSQLRVFRDRLQDVDNEWKKHAEYLSQNISDDVASFVSVERKQ